MKDEPISTLLRRFAGPAVIANLISALYTIVDQIFIGQGVGYLGNAATNIAFPITTISMALALMLGIGTAANFNLEMGRGNVKRAEKMVGTTFGSLIILGVVMSALLLLFTKPLMSVFGATAELMPYVLPFVRITALSLPFFLISTACNSIVRARWKCTLFDVWNGCWGNLKHDLKSDFYFWIQVGDRWFGLGNGDQSDHFWVHLFSLYS